MYVETCPFNKKLDCTVNVLHKDEREKVYQIGQDLAVRSGIHFEGCYFVTQDPYSIEQAKPILYFD